MRTVRRKIFTLALALFIFTGAAVLLQPFGNSGRASPQLVPHSAYAQEDTRAVSNVVIQINDNSEAVVTWNPPTDAPADYRISWIEADQERFPSYTEDHGNAYPIGPTYTITDLAPGVRYKVTLRARYNGPAGPWTNAIEFDVPAPPTLTATATPTAAPTSTATATPTATGTMTATPTPTPDPRAVSNVVIQINDNSEAVVTWNPPTDAPADYRISWIEADQERFPSYTEDHGNAYPIGPTYTITDLAPGVRYKVTLRARRYNGPAGPWTNAIEFATLASVKFRRQRNSFAHSLHSTSPFVAATLWLRQQLPSSLLKLPSGWL